MSHLPLSLLILALSWAFCDAQCSRTPAKGNGCIKNGKLHSVHKVWRTNDCERCECKPEEMVCCSVVVPHSNYNRKKCIPMFHRASCSIRLVRKSNPSELCPVFAGFG